MPVIITGVILLAVDCCGLGGIGPCPREFCEMNRDGTKGPPPEAMSPVIRAVRCEKPTWPRALITGKPLRAARPGTLGLDCGFTGAERFASGLSRPSNP